MVKKMNLMDYLTVGFKDLVGGIIASLLFAILYIILGIIFTASLLEVKGMFVIFMIVLIAGFLLNLIFTGFILNKLWGWK